MLDDGQLGSIDSRLGSIVGGGSFTVYIDAMLPCKTEISSFGLKID